MKRGEGKGRWVESRTGTEELRASKERNREKGGKRRGIEMKWYREK